MKKIFVLLDLLVSVFCCGCGENSGSTTAPMGSTLVPYANQIISLANFVPLSGQIIIGCESDGSMPINDTVSADGTVTPGMNTYISRMNTVLQGWYYRTWGVNAVIQSGPGDGRFCNFFTNSPSYNDQGYSLLVNGQWQCYCNMPLSLSEGTPFTSASHEIFNQLVGSMGGPQICGPVAPTSTPDLISDATTPNYWNGSNNGPYDRTGDLAQPYPAVVSGGAIGQ